MTRPPWVPDELAYAGPEHLDATYVAGYEQKAGAEWRGDLALLRELGLSEHSVLVDLGAGAGSLAVAAAPLCRRVVAVDVSPAMLTLLRDRAAQLGLGNLEAVQQGLLSYEHQGEPADFVYSRNVLHHLPDFWKASALQRMAAMLKQGGVLRLRDLVFAFAPGETDRAIAAWLAGAAQQPDGRLDPRRTGRAPARRSTAPSPGCWSRCWSGPASPSSAPSTARHRCTPHMFASSAEAAAISTVMV